MLVRVHVCDRVRVCVRERESEWQIANVTSDRHRYALRLVWWRLVWHTIKLVICQLGRLHVNLRAVEMRACDLEDRHPSRSRADVVLQSALWNSHKQTLLGFPQCSQNQINVPHHTRKDVLLNLLKPSLFTAIFFFHSVPRLWLIATLNCCQLEVVHPNARF